MYWIVVPVVIFLGSFGVFSLQVADDDAHSAGDLIIDSVEAGIDNVILFYTDDTHFVVSGSMPRYDTGFDTLKELGITTIISTDAAMPDLHRAKARDMRYIHIPLKYSRITPDQRAALAKAIRDADGPVYVHCHHGTHRGPAGAAIGLVGLGLCTNDDAVALMRVSGTSEAYTGLWRDVSNAAALTTSDLDAVTLVETAETGTLEETMAEMDRVFDNLVLLAKTNWQAPWDHPDLSAESESGQLADLFRLLLNEKAQPVPYDERYTKLMEISVEQAEHLETQILLGSIKASALTLESLNHSCKECHDSYR